MDRIEFIRRKIKFGTHPAPHLKQTPEFVFFSTNFPLFGKAVKTPVQFVTKVLLRHASRRSLEPSELLQDWD